MRLTYEEVQEINQEINKVVMTADSALVKLANYLRDIEEAIQIYPESTVARSTVLQDKEGY